MKETWHYTDARNVKSILKKGLIPYRLNLKAVSEATRKEWGIKNPKGVWLWKKRQRGVSHAGIILNQFVRKEAKKVALLRVLVKHEEVNSWPNKLSISTYHVGFIGKWYYHWRTQAWISRVKIPPERIKLVKVYDVVKLLQ